MGSAVADSAEETAPGRGDNGVYAAELKAASLSLSVDETVLARLLAPLGPRAVAPRQVSRLLAKAWARLRALDGVRQELAALAGDDSGLLQRIEWLFEPLCEGEGFSLEVSDQRCQQWYRQAVEGGLRGELGAHLLGLQAQLAALGQDYRRAAECFAQAAAVAPLGVAQRWRFQLSRAVALEESGRVFGDAAALEEAIELYRAEGLPLAPEADRPRDWALTQHRLGAALACLGQGQRGTRSLEESIQAFERALAGRSRQADPLAWAETQQGLGEALGMLAQRHADTDMLEQAIAAFEAALEERSRERSPQDWADSQYSLATALLTLGQRNKDKTLLGRAADAYKNALLVWRRDLTPLAWADTMHCLGTALRLLGELRKGPRTLEQSVAAYQSALAERTRQRVPRDWAMTHNSLGAALHKLGERQQDAAVLTDAMTAYENALEECCREREPLTWAMTLANLAAAKKARAQLCGEVALVRSALQDFAAVGEVFRAASHAQYYELVIEQIAKLRELEGRLPGAGT